MEVSLQFKQRWLTVLVVASALAASRAMASDDCDCDNDCSVWSARASALFMERTNPQSQTLINFPGNFVGPPTGTPVFNADDFNFDFRAGLDVSVFRQLDSCYDLEFRYVGIEWNANNTVDLAGPGFGNFATNPATPFIVGPAGANFNFGNSTDFDSLEVNVRRTGRMNNLIGFRAISLSDDFNGTFDFLPAPPLTAILNSDVSNHLYGFQIGSDGTLGHYRNLRVDGMVKVGGYYNDADSVVETFQPPTILAARAIGEEKSFAFLGEVGLYGVYQLNDSWALRAGYQLMWLTGVALAPDQINDTGNLAFTGTAPTALDTDDGFLAHGATVGVETAW